MIKSSKNVLCADWFAKKELFYLIILITFRKYGIVSQIFFITPSSFLRGESAKQIDEFIFMAVLINSPVLFLCL